MNTWKDAFGATLMPGHLVTYAMKPPGGGGLVYPRARIVDEAPAGQVIVRIEDDWFDDYNKLEACVRAPRMNALKRQVRIVYPVSLILLQFHPSFPEEQKADE